MINKRRLKTIRRVLTGDNSYSTSKDADTLETDIRSIVYSACNQLGNLEVDNQEILRKMFKDISIIAFGYLDGDKEWNKARRDVFGRRKILLENKIQELREEWQRRYKFLEAINLESRDGTYGCWFNIFR